MSHQATHWAMRQNCGKRAHGAYRVLQVLAYHAGKDGVAWPGVELIAGTLGIGLLTVKDHLRTLGRSGLIARFRRSDAEGHPVSWYTVLAPNHNDRGEMVDSVDNRFLERSGMPLSRESP
ncbi:MAG: hypothetical protein ACTHQQ_01025 [Solirubrobacteraceae bacterium]